MIKLAKPCITEEAIRQVADVLRSGNLVQGQQVKAFEEELRDYLGAQQVVVVSSGTAALHLSLLALDIKPGDEVIVPAFTFPATANAVELCGARPVLVDIGTDDYCIDVSKIEQAITPQTKAIMPVHEFGQSADIDAIQKIAKSHSLYLVEDAACALGTENAGRKIGTMGVAGCFSFHPRKAITTGEGGAIAVMDPVLAQKIMSLRNHGIIPRDGKQDFVMAGLNYRMTDFQAALGRVQLRGFDAQVCRRTEQADIYDKAFSGMDEIQTPRRLTDRKHTYQTYHILLSHDINRDKLISILKNVDIETNLGAQSLHSMEFYKQKYHYRENDFPNALRAYRQGLALPIGPHVDEDNIQCVAKEIKSAIQLCHGK